MYRSFKFSTQNYIFIISEFSLATKKSCGFGFLIEVLVLWREARKQENPEKTLGARIWWEPTTNSTWMWRPGPGIEPGSHWGEASALTTAPFELYCDLHGEVALQKGVVVTGVSTTKFSSWFFGRPWSVCCRFAGIFFFFFSVGRNYNRRTMLLTLSTFFIKCVMPGLN